MEKIETFGRRRLENEKEILEREQASKSDLLTKLKAEQAEKAEFFKVLAIP